MRNFIGFYTHNELNNIQGAEIDGLADPFIFRFNGYYYLFYTAACGLKSYKSKDLLHFDLVDNHVLERGFVSQDPLLKHAYAPEVLYFNGSFYIITSLAGTGHRILKSSNVEGPYNFITGNIHQSIDGSFFVDNDEKVYLTRASETGICLLEMKKTIDGFVEENGVPKAKYFTGCRMHDWTEGPYILKRYGRYFLTYTGTHFLSDAYRINYSTSLSLNGAKPFRTHDLLSISTTKEFYGLGHSMTFLSPNLDSYLIAYHNMEDDGKRLLNINRLMFDGNKMIINDLSKNMHPVLERPLFESYNLENLIEDNNNKTTDSFDLNSFSIEYCFKGENQCIFSYKNDLDYFYFELKNNCLSLFHKIENLLEKIYSFDFKNNYSLEFLHSLRIQYKNKIVAIYLDNVELTYGLKVEVEKLYKVGVSKNTECSYLAISKYSFGDSDNEEIKFNKILASHFDLSSDIKKETLSKGCLKLKPGESVKYKVYADEDGEYNLDSLFKLYIPYTEIRINVNKETYSFKNIDYIRDSKICLLKINLVKGINEIMISCSQETLFESFEISKHQKHDLNSLELDLSKDYKLLKYSNPEAPIVLNSGIYFENDRNFAYIDEIFDDFDVSTECEIFGNTYKDREVAGLNVCVSNYSKSNGFEREDSLCGYIYAYNKKYIYILEAKFEDTKLLFKRKNDDFKHTLRVIKKENTICFCDGEKPIYTHFVKKGNIRGLVGLYMSHESVLFKNLKVRLENKNEQ